VILSRGGDLKIIDFGIAAFREEPEGDATRPALTRTGFAMGTPAYMPPEQLRDMRRTTPASDIYSLGAIFMEMLTGRRPHDEPAAGDPLAGVPRPLRRIVLTCLREEPGKRYKNAAVPAGKLRGYFRKLTRDEAREIIAEYVFRNSFPPSSAKMKPLYSSFIASFGESPARKKLLLWGAPSAIIAVLLGLLLFTDAYFAVFKRSTHGRLEIAFDLPVHVPLRRLSWYRAEKKMPDRRRNPGLYEDRAKEVTKVLHDYISEEYSDMLFNFRMSAWLMGHRALGRVENGREKLVLSPKNYVRPLVGDDFEIVLPDDGTLPEHLTLSSGVIFRKKGNYSTMLLLNGASYRTHFRLDPMAEQNHPETIVTRYAVTPRNKITFNFTFFDRASSRPIDGMDVKILWGATYYDWKDFSSKKEKMDYLWNGRSFTFRISHPGYTVPAPFDVRVDRDQTIANVVLWLDPAKKAD